MPKDFFNQKEIKLLRKIAGGDTYTIIYQKMLLESLDKDGILTFDGIGRNFSEELALTLDEEVENVEITVSFLMNKGLMQVYENGNYFLSKFPVMVGSETESAERQRRYMERQKQQQKIEETSQNDVSASQNDGEVLESDGVNDGSLTERREEKRREREREESKKENASSSKLKFETHHMQLAELLFKKIKENNPNAKDPNYESWANTFRLMMERDNRTGKEVQDLILFSQQHHFWHKNILSPDKLRKQFDRLQMEKQSDDGFKAIKGGAPNEKSSYQSDDSKYDFNKDRILF